jgi:hypothetical protein
MGTPLFFTLSLVISNSNHSTLLEIHSSTGTSEYGGRYNISGRATRYGLTVRGSSPDFPYPSLQTMRYWVFFQALAALMHICICTVIYSYGSGLSRDESILWSRSLGLKSISLEPMAPFVKIYENCLVVCWLTLDIRHEKGDIWNQRK